MTRAGVAAKVVSALFIVDCVVAHNVLFAPSEHGNFNHANIATEDHYVDPSWAEFKGCPTAEDLRSAPVA